MKFCQEFRFLPHNSKKMADFAHLHKQNAILTCSNGLTEQALLSSFQSAMPPSLPPSGGVVQPTQLFSSALVLGYYLMEKGRIQVNKLTSPHLSQLEGRARGRFAVNPASISAGRCSY